MWRRPTLDLTVLALISWQLAAGAELGARPSPSHSAAAVESLLREAPDAGAFAERLIEDRAPDDLARLLRARRDLVPAVLERLGRALAESRRPALAAYLSATARALSREIAAADPPWNDDDVDLLLTVQMVDPLRFVEEPAFRERVLSFLPRSLAPAVGAELRDRLLFELNHVRGFGFEASEEVELAWGAVPRRSAERRLPWDFGRFQLPHAARGAIEVSIYSLSSQYFDAGEAGRFLAAVERWAPERTIVVLADLPLRRALAAGRGERTVLVETHGRAYTPWVRDPLLLARRDGGGVVLVARPNRQPRREADSDLGRELVQGLPASLDAVWGEVRWTTAPVPFHNGQVLLTDDALWLSLHSLEPRILELLGLERVPVASFATAEGIDRYLGAARTAAAELAVLYGRPPRFIHALPEGGPIDERTAAMARIGGGAGFDLDSLLTLLPAAGSPDRRPAALVADPRAGVALLERLSADDWQRLRTAYDLVAEPGALGAVLGEYQARPRAQRLGLFLDAVAEHLAAQEFRVLRLAHLLVPTALLPESGELDHADFQLTWNNVVLDTAADGTLRAEGFASLLPLGDGEARRIFAEAGCRLELLPALVPSIVRNGGYRCASNHLRAGAAAGFVERIPGRQAL